jgi:hypothetical protein
MNDLFCQQQAVTTSSYTTTTPKQPSPLSKIPRRLPIIPKPNPFPPVKQVIQGIQTKGIEMVGTFLMDLAIIGFAKLWHLYDE